MILIAHLKVYVVLIIETYIRKDSIKHVLLPRLKMYQFKNKRKKRCCGNHVNQQGIRRHHHHS